MELKEIQSLYENKSNKGVKREMENNDFKTKLFLLDQEYKKRFNELMIFYKTEKNKILIQHTQNERGIDLQ
jgi:stress response protein SCP2